EIGDTKVLEDALNTVGSVLGESGRYEESLRYLYECLDVARAGGDVVMRYMSLLNIGDAYVRSGDPDKAEAPLRESLQTARDVTDDGKGIRTPKKATEMALLQLGAMEFARERYSAALNDYEQVHASRPQSPLWVIAALEGMADVHRVLGQHQQAIELLSQAMPVAEQSASGLQLARLVSAMGVSQQSLGHLEEALASQQRALARVHKDGGNT